MQRAPTRCQTRKRAGRGLRIATPACGLVRNDNIFSGSAHCAPPAIFCRGGGSAPPVFGACSAGAGGVEPRPYKANYSFPQGGTHVCRRRYCAATRRRGTRATPYRIFAGDNARIVPPDNAPQFLLCLRRAGENPAPTHIMGILQRADRGIRPYADL